jgi:tRNA threonylcarbamoyladenosine biosynthesis protein TsaB
MPAMSILAIDTTGPVIGVALLVGEEVLQHTERVRRGSEQRLVPWAQALCADAELKTAELDGIAVAVGPGAFTGLRVGLATAVGIALAGGIPIVGLSSLGSRAAPLSAQTRVLSMLDARKSRVYAQWFAHGTPLDSPADISPEVLLEAASPGFVATGEGAGCYRELVESAGGRVHDAWESPAVDALARMGESALARGEAVDPASLRPVYIRPPDARPPKFD